MNHASRFEALYEAYFQGKLGEGWQRQLEAKDKAQFQRLMRQAYNAVEAVRAGGR